jgi:hypothetical protein
MEAVVKTAGPSGSPSALSVASSAPLKPGSVVPFSVSHLKAPLAVQAGIRSTPSGSSQTVSPGAVLAGSTFGTPISPSKVEANVLLPARVRPCCCCWVHCCDPFDPVAGCCEDGWKARSPSTSLGALDMMPQSKSFRLRLRRPDKAPSCSCCNHPCAPRCPCSCEFEGASPRTCWWWCCVSPIDPDSPKKVRFDTLIAFATVYVAFMSPFQASFGQLQELRPLEVIIDLIFALHVWLEFRTSFEDPQKPGELVSSVPRIARRYCHSWFFTDLLASLPFELATWLVEVVLSSTEESNFQQSSSTALLVLRVLSFLRVFRLLRLGRLWVIASRLKVSAYVQLVRLLFSFALGSHIFACLFWAIPKLEQSWGSFSALPQRFADGPSSWAEEQGLLDSDVTMRTKYTTSLYWSVTTLTSVGYGDITSISVGEKAFNVFVMSIGVLTYSILFGSITTLLASLNAHEAKFREKIDAVNAFMRELRLPKRLQQRVRAFFDFSFSRQIEGRAVLEELPVTLQGEVLDWAHRRMLLRCPVMADAEAQFVQLLSLKLEQVIALPDEFIFSCGDAAADIYFVKEGEVAILGGLADREGWGGAPTPLPTPDVKDEAVENEEETDIDSSPIHKVASNRGGVPGGLAKQDGGAIGSPKESSRVSKAVSSLRDRVTRLEDADPENTFARMGLLAKGLLAWSKKGHEDARGEPGPHAMRVRHGGEDGTTTSSHKLDPTRVLAAMTRHRRVSLVRMVEDAQETNPTATAAAVMVNHEEAQIHGVGPFRVRRSSEVSMSRRQMLGSQDLPRRRSVSGGPRGSGETRTPSNSPSDEGKQPQHAVQTAFEDPSVRAPEPTAPAVQPVAIKPSTWFSERRFGNVQGSMKRITSFRGVNHPPPEDIVAGMASQMSMGSGTPVLSWRSSDSYFGDEGCLACNPRAAYSVLRASTAGTAPINEILQATHDSDGESYEGGEGGARLTRSFSLSESEGDEEELSVRERARAIIKRRRLAALRPWPEELQLPDASPVRVSGSHKVSAMAVTFCELYRLSLDQLSLLLDLFSDENVSMQIVAKKRLQAAHQGVFYNDSAMTGAILQLRGRFEQACDEEIHLRAKRTSSQAPGKQAPLQTVMSASYESSDSDDKKVLPESAVQSHTSRVSKGGQLSEREDFPRQSIESARRSHSSASAGSSSRSLANQQPRSLSRTKDHVVGHTVAALRLPPRLGSRRLLGDGTPASPVGGVTAHDTSRAMSPFHAPPSVQENPPTKQQVSRDSRSRGSRSRSSAVGTHLPLSSATLSRFKSGAVVAEHREFRARVMAERNGQDVDMSRTLSFGGISARGSHGVMRRAQSDLRRRPDATTHFAPGMERIAETSPLLRTDSGSRAASAGPGARVWDAIPQDTTSPLHRIQGATTRQRAIEAALSSSRNEPTGRSDTSIIASLLAVLRSEIREGLDRVEEKLDQQATRLDILEGTIQRVGRDVNKLLR